MVVRSAAEQNLNAHTMQFQIRSYNPKNQVPPHSFFDLSKGLNSGKPLFAPCPNCFVVTTKDEEVKEFVYWLIYGLWQSRAFYVFHTGSVIPFIRIDEFRSFVLEKFRQARQEDEKHSQVIKALRSLEDREKQYMQNITLIQEAKRAIFYRYMKK